MSETAERTDPKLWETVKDEVTRGDKGGEKGQWSARKAQLAVTEYKKRGGGYKGEKDEDNSLSEWGREEWGTKSGAKSKDSGERYLPKSARDDLSDEEYARTTRKKRDDTAKGKQFSSQPDDVAKKTAKHRGGGDGKDGEDHAPTKSELMDRARDLEVDGRSKMDRGALEKAVAKAKDSGEAKGGGSRRGGSDPVAASKAELMKRARAQNIAGRSKMNRDQLAKALSGANG